MSNLISVIIPAYNSERYIEETINSVISQTWDHYEIIVIDDGSKDHTNDVVESIANRYPEKIKYYFQINQGTGKTRNAAIEKAQGDYIAFLDADDIWLPRKLQKQMDALNTKQYDLVFTNAGMVDQEGKDLSRLYAKNSEMNIAPENMYLRLLLRNFIPFSSILMKRPVFDRVGTFDNRYGSSEDTEWLLRVAHDYKVGCVNEALIQYRLHPANKSRNLEFRHRDSINILKVNIEKYPEISDLLGKKLNRRLAGKYASLGYELFAQYRFKEAREQIRHSIRYDPLFRPSKYAYLILTYVPIGWIKKLRNLKQGLPRKHKDEG